MTMVRTYAERRQADARTAITTMVICGQSVAALGPTLGGLLVGLLGWQSILWVNLPVVGLSVIAVLHADVGTSTNDRMTVRETLRSLDWFGVALFLIALTSTMLLLVSLRGAPPWWLGLVVILSIAGFWCFERHVTDPFLDVRALIENKALAATLGRTTLNYTCFYCIFFGIPQWLQYSRGMSAIAAGLTMLPVAGVSVLATFVGSRVYGRYGARRTLVVGTGALLVGGILIALVEKTTAPLLVIPLVAAVLGIPNGFNNIGNQSLVNAVTSVDDVGTAMGMYRTATFVGANLAIVTLQTVAGDEITDAGLHRVGWFIAGAAAVLLAGVLSSNHMADSKR